MIRLFRRFDSNFFYLWFVNLSLFFFTSTFYFFKLNLKIFYFNFFCSNFLEGFFQSTKNKIFTKFSLNFIVSLFFFIFFINFFSLIPFNFAVSSQLSVVFLLSFIPWSVIFMFYLMKNFRGIFSHMVPEGSPLFLSWFLFLIELVSFLIRSFTLTVRLISNVVAGHLIMHLTFILILNYFFIFPFYFIINILELFVCVIQSWIFSILISLYYSELI